MPAISLLPVQHAFREGVEYHRSRVPISDRDINKVSAEIKKRALWVSGVAHQASAVEVHRLLDKHFTAGGTAGEWRAGLTKLLAQNGGSVLPFARQNNILRTNAALTYANGRMTQLQLPEVVAERPILMYPKGPHDTKTTAICLSLEGFMAEASSPVWNHIAPPNHFQERHLKLLSLTREQAAARGRVYQQPEGGGEYPVLDGRQILPDSGFDMPPQITAADSKQLAGELAEIVKPRAAKTSADYNLRPLEQLDAAKRIDLPDLDPAVDAEDAWEALRDALDFADDAASTITTDIFNDGVVLNRGSFDAIFGQAPELAPLLRPLLEEATEVWFVPFETVDAGLTIVKRYLGVFGAGDDVLYLWAEQGPGGWLGRGGRASAEELEQLRRGYLASTRSDTTPEGNP